MIGLSNVTSGTYDIRQMSGNPFTNHLVYRDDWTTFVLGNSGFRQNVTVLYFCSLVGEIFRLSIMTYYTSCPFIVLFEFSMSE